MSAKTKREPVGLTGIDIFNEYGPRARKLDREASDGDEDASRKLVEINAFYLDLIRAIDRKRRARARAEKKAAPRG